MHPESCLSPRRIRFALDMTCFEQHRIHEQSKKLAPFVFLVDKNKIPFRPSRTKGEALRGTTLVRHALRRRRTLTPTSIRGTR
jgi:hypothetical protein